MVSFPQEPVGPEAPSLPWGVALLSELVSIRLSVVSKLQGPQ